MRVVVVCLSLNLLWRDLRYGSPWGGREMTEGNLLSGASWHPNFGHMLPVNMKRECSRNGPPDTISNP